MATLSTHFWAGAKLETFSKNFEVQKELNKEMENLYTCGIKYSRITCRMTENLSPFTAIEGFELARGATDIKKGKIVAATVGSISHFLLLSLNYKN